MVHYDSKWHRIRMYGITHTLFSLSGTCQVMFGTFDTPLPCQSRSTLFSLQIKWFVFAFDAFQLKWLSTLETAVPCTCVGLCTAFFKDTLNLSKGQAIMMKLHEGITLSSTFFLSLTIGRNKNKHLYKLSWMPFLILRRILLQNLTNDTLF